ncbi:MAG TPA: FlgD immunoglobulin-like domain containing protein, partial [Planctomycetota bacterium]|nr:FlgD immunoglobulin-like domain containing protein [Planctomycetota bacterium]
MRTLFRSILIMAASMSFAHAERTLNHGLHAVPAPKTVRIDGDLAEWDTSGAIACCKDVNALLDVESCRVSAMWDAENIYLAFEFRDATPMQNKVDPATMAGNGWRSDAVQLRCNMAGFVTHLDLWYFTDKQQAAMSIRYGRFGADPLKIDRPADPTKLGARQAFKLSADRAGYVQEVKLPWAVITEDGKLPPKQADLRLGLELFWGDVTAEGWPRSRVTDNLFDGATQTDFFWTSVNNWGRLILEEQNNITLPPPGWMLARKAEPKGLVPITFTLPAESFVTLAIEDAAGNRVNSLLGGVKLPKGENTVYWSGLNDRNGLLPAGTYRWVGLYRDQIDVNWLMSFYQPNKVTPWGNADGTGAWGPDHGTLRVAAAGDGRVYLAGTGVEAGFALFAVDLDGRKLWTVKMAESDRIAYADGMVYAYSIGGGVNFLGIAPTGLVQIDAKTGKWIDIP